MAQIALKLPQTRPLVYIVNTHIIAVMCLNAVGIFFFIYFGALLRQENFGGASLKGFGCSNDSRPYCC